MDADKVLKTMAASGKRIATETLDRSIGQHVLALIEREGEVSVDSLMSSLHRTISAATSGDQERSDQILPRMQAEAALSRIQVLLDSLD